MDIDVNSLARLARLELHHDELQALRSDLERIVTYVKTLDDLALDPSEGESTDAGMVQNAWRGDEVGSHLARQRLLANAPDHDGETFVVPRVV